MENMMPISQLAWLALALVLTFFSVIHFMCSVWACFSDRVSMSVQVLIGRAIYAGVPLAGAYWIFESFIK